MRVYLRALELPDAENLVKWRNDPEVTSSLGGNTFFVSGYREADWIKNAIMNDTVNLRLSICLVENDLHIGNVNLTAISWINRSAEFSIMLGDKSQWGKGLGTEATKLMLKHAFEELNLHRVYLTVRNDNESAMKLYEKAGFKQEGIMRESVFKNNKYVTMNLMSILKNEFNG
jgi:RimJ/RimL family protein N-acetyltransferase